MSSIQSIHQMSTMMLVVLLVIVGSRSDDDDAVGGFGVIRGTKNKFPVEVAELKSYDFYNRMSNNTSSSSSSSSSSHQQTHNISTLRKFKKKLVITTVLDPPFVMLKETSHYITGNERFEGFLIDVINHLLSPLMVDFEIRLANESKYGKLRNNFFWDGAIGEVHRRTADIALGPLVISEVAKRTIDFTEPYLSLRYSALIAKPKVQKRDASKENGITSTSKTKQQTILLQQSQQQPQQQQQQQQQQLFELPQHWQQKPHHHHPHRHHHTRHRPTYDQPIHHKLNDNQIIKDLTRLAESGMTCGVIKDSLPDSLLNLSTHPEHKFIFSKMSQAWPTAYVHTRQEGVGRARLGNYAFIIDTPIAEYEAGKQPCDLYTTEPFLDMVEYAFILSKNATLEYTENHEGLKTGKEQKENPKGSKSVFLKDVLDAEIKKMKSGDEMQAMYLHWWRDECVSSNQRFNNFNEKDDADGKYQELYEKYLNDLQTSEQISKHLKHHNGDRNYNSTYLLPLHGHGHSNALSGYSKSFVIFISVIIRCALVPTVLINFVHIL